MNHNKHKKSGIVPTGEDVPLSADEYVLYQQLLELSYPRPKKSIRDEVMKQIRAESGSESAESPLLCAFTGSEAKSSRRKAHMNRFVRYGSIAACFVLLIGAVIGIAPMLSRTEADDAAAYVHQNTVTTYASTDAAPTTDTVKPENWKEEAKKYNGTIMKSALNDTAPMRDSAEPESPAEISETQPETAVLFSMALTSTNAAESPEAESPEAEEDAAEAVCEAAPAAVYDCAEAEEACVCTIHDAAYHSFPASLVALTGQKAFDAWYSLPEAADTCGIPSVYRFVRYFGFSAEQFSALECAGEYDLSQLFPEE